MERYSQNKQTLITHLDEIKALVDEAEWIHRFKTTVPKFLNWEYMDGGDKSFIKESLSKPKSENRILFNSLFITSVAGFESFLSKTIDTSIRVINDKKRKTSSFNRNFLNRQIEFSGKILNSIYSPPNHMTIDFPNVCKNIATIHHDSTNLILNPEISAYFKSILELKSFAEFFNDLDIDVSIDTLSKKSDLQDVFKGSGARDTKKIIESFIKETIVYRNRIAHTGQSSSDISKQKIEDLILKLKSLATNISDIIHDKI